ncbi:MAG: hypothetical protein FWD71_00895 [Oscillospiraceae bacterium]|nr:hypothetical protein [Oscillospiraceae bacterium]
MITLDENKLLTKLNELMEIEVGELRKYSETAVCSTAKEGSEKEYARYKKIVQLIQETKNDILFTAFFQ